jgi:hypothetical protein
MLTNIDNFKQPQPNPPTSTRIFRSIFGEDLRRLFVGRAGFDLDILLLGKGDP